jgi:hypothetical protein
VVVGATFPSVGAVMVAVLFAIGLILLVATGTKMKAAVRQSNQHQPRMLRDLRDGFVFMLRTPWLLWTLLFASMFVLVVEDRSRCCCHSSPSNDLKTARGCSVSSWGSSVSAAHWARWPCRGDGCHVATSR